MPGTRPHIVVVGAGIAGLTSVIKIGEGVEARLKTRRPVDIGADLALPEPPAIDESMFEDAALSNQLDEEESARRTPVFRGTIETRPVITVLEADTTVGGRARTEILSNGVAVDSGPHWFHGGKDHNRFYRWATEDKHYPLGTIGLDTAKQRVNLAAGETLSQAEREWAASRLSEMYAVWKSQHPGEDISVGQLADMSGSPLLRKIADERANNWMALPSADDVSANEFWGDDAGSGGMQLAEGMETLIGAMRADAEYYGADIHTRTPVRAVFAIAGSNRRRFRVVTDKRIYKADHVIVTPSVGVLKSGAIKFDDYTRSQLDPILAGMTPAKMTKIFIPVREEFFAERGVNPNTFLTVYDDKHSWLLHLRTAGKPTVTVFAAGAVSELVETMKPRVLEREMFALLNRIEMLAGIEGYLDGRILRTDWSTNGHYLCSYSAMRPGYQRRNPLVVGNLVFTGEAWVEMKKSPSTMDGAHNAGIIAAKKTLAKLVAAP